MGNLATLKPIPFQKGYDPRRKLNLDGRPKKLLSQFASQGYKASEVIDLIKALTSLTKKELEAVRDNPDATALDLLITKAILKDIKDSTFYTFEPLIQRIAGKVAQPVTIEQTPQFQTAKDVLTHGFQSCIKESGLDVENLSDEDRTALESAFGQYLAREMNLWGDVE